MDFMSNFKMIFYSVWELLRYDLNFPEPIGEISSMDITMFFATAYLLADSVSMVASRRD